ncbi:MAG: YdcF family protein [Rhodococcus sp. (in: high G+C Gram-positive bacteria)]|uniref:YdcF family protein n=1 Tax=Rhodococcus sp. TaxID=1831 RepID=UPI003BAFC143
MLGLAVAVVVAVTFVGASGYVLYNHARVDAIEPVDAIIVLGGDHDGRVEYGIRLAEQGVSKNVVLSNPYTHTTKAMSKVCDTRPKSFSVTCVPPAPATTRGEALFTRELASRYGWDSVLVISWRYHLPRARYIFSQCFPGKVLMRPVPREYDFSLAEWEYTYIYQSVGFVKALIQGSC